jgi:hypothetical protein
MPPRPGFSMMRMSGIEASIRIGVQDPGRWDPPFEDRRVGLHLTYDVIPDAIYRTTGMYFVPAGRSACQ